MQGRCAQAGKVPTRKSGTIEFGLAPHILINCLLYSNRKWGISHIIFGQNPEFLFIVSTRTLLKQEQYLKNIEYIHVVRNILNVISRMIINGPYFAMLILRKQNLRRTNI